MVALPNGTQLKDFAIVRVLGQGGFGVTYLAEDRMLRKMFAIKEYFPQVWAYRSDKDSVSVAPNSASKTDYSWGLKRFVAEARTLAKFRHPNIVNVNAVIRANNTAYMVLDYEDGVNFDQWLKKIGRMPTQDELDQIAEPLLDALTLIHGNKILHRDISPDKIYIRNQGAPVLLDFGAARHDLGRHSRSVTTIIKPGYSPIEQYSTEGRNQGPWTDIYALSATLYRAVTGKRPAEATDRAIDDELAPAVEAARSRYRRSFLAAIDHGLEPRHEMRPQSVRDWGPKLLQGARSATERRRLAAPASLLAKGVPAAGGRAAWITAAAVLFVCIVGAAGYYLGAGPAFFHASPVQDAARQSDDAAWAIAREQNTLSAYRAYLAAHPDGLYSGQAKSEIASLQKAGPNDRELREQNARDDAAWERARQANKTAAFQAYLAEYPEGRHALAANARIAALAEAENRRKEEQARREAEAERQRSDETAWAMAQRDDTLDAYRAYLGKHAEGRHAAEANARIAALVAEAEQRRREEQARREAGERRREAEAERRRRDEAAWATARREDRIGAYRTYLEKFPDGAYVNVAHASLRRLDDWAKQAQDAARTNEASKQGEPGKDLETASTPGPELCARIVERAQLGTLSEQDRNVLARCQ